MHGKPGQLNVNNNGSNDKVNNRENECNNDAENNKLLSSDGGTASADVMSPKTVIDLLVDRGITIDLVKTSSGCQFVQQKLSDKQYFAFFFTELKCHVAELMVSIFGHYAIETLFHHCDDHQRLILVANLSKHISQVACDRQGSCSIQAMMETLSTAEQIKCLVDALNKQIKKIILDHCGHSVILRFLQRYDYPYSKFIHKALMQHTFDVATNYYGSRVVKACVDAGPIQEMSAVFASIVKDANILVDNPYGNYMIQHLLDLGHKEVTDTIKEKIRGKCGYIYNPQTKNESGQTLMALCRYENIISYKKTILLTYGYIRNNFQMKHIPNDIIELCIKFFYIKCTTYEEAMDILLNKECSFGFYDFKQWRTVMYIQNWDNTKRIILRFTEKKIKSPSHLRGDKFLTIKNFPTNCIMRDPEIFMVTEKDLRNTTKYRQ
eukprot:277803_1